MNIHEIRNQVGREEVDYVTLKSILSAYHNPRDKIARLVRGGTLTRVKKGLYVFGPEASRRPYSMMTLANQIYGPSAISLHWALSYYGMIPERVEEVTSVTPSRNRLFETPVGRFSYVHQALPAYPDGIVLGGSDSDHRVLIASREKALVDTLVLDRSVPRGLSGPDDLHRYLVDSLRIEESDLRTLRLGRLQILARIHQVEIATDLVRLVRSIRESSDA